jgi:hypothetical protein
MYHFSSAASPSLTSPQRAIVVAAGAAAHLSVHRWDMGIVTEAAVAAAAVSIADGAWPLLLLLVTPPFLFEGGLDERPQSLLQCASSPCPAESPTRRPGAFGCSWSEHARRAHDVCFTKVSRRRALASHYTRAGTPPYSRSSAAPGPVSASSPTKAVLQPCATC